MTNTWSVAVFAHNEAATIAATLGSILTAGEGSVAIEVVVLANGCADRTALIVRELAVSAPNLHVVEIALGDKANAWNHYVHEVSASLPFSAAQMHVFVDGDVHLAPGALPALAAALAQEPSANAAGGLPVSGRDRVAWRARMIANGMLAGGLYALRASFVDRIRRREIRIPQGLIGEDWLVSFLAKSDLKLLPPDASPAAPVVFALDAGFSFRSLSPLRIADGKTYLRRLWRYALRGVQFDMLYPLLVNQPPEALPADVDQLYRLVPAPSRLKWVGTQSALRLLAVYSVRRRRARRSAHAR